jgi:hypothetical protein
MKNVESTFESNIKNVNNYNLHNYNPINISNKEDFCDINNIIIYGARGIGKYSQALKIIELYSKSKLKYERKLTFLFNKEEYKFPLSDIHVEVDFSLLGCASKILWHDIFINYIDIVLSKSEKNGFILCKNFDDIHIELHDVFFSYMSNYSEHLNIKFIILTENISFINNDILNRCSIINLSKPSKNDIIKCSKCNSNKNNIVYYHNEFHTKICDKIINYITNIENFNINTFRELLYELLIYNIRISTAIWYIIKEIFKTGTYNQHTSDIILKTVSFFHYYNNNYRPIYHLEKFFVNLINTIHGFKSIDENIEYNKK